MTPTRIFAVARIFLRQAWEGKLLLLAAPFLVILGFALVLPVTRDADRALLVREAGLQGGVILAVLACVGMAATHPARCAETGELAQVVSGPVRRLGWVLGEALGLALLAAVLVGACFLGTGLFCGAVFGLDSVRLADSLPPVEQRSLGADLRFHGDTQEEVWYQEGVEARFRLPADAVGGAELRLRPRLARRDERLILKAPVRVSWAFGDAPPAGRELVLRDDLEERLPVEAPAGSAGWVRLEFHDKDTAVSLPVEESWWGDETRGLRLHVPREPVLVPWLRAAGLEVLEVLLAGAAALCVVLRYSPPVGLLFGTTVYLAGCLHGTIVEFVRGAATAGEVATASGEIGTEAAHTHGVQVLQVAPWAREVLNALHLYLPDRAPLDGAGGLAAGLYVPREALVSGVAEAAPFLVAFLVLGFLLFRGRDL